MRSKRARDAAAVGLLTLAVVAFFWPLIFTTAWIPRGGGDLVSFLWPRYHFAARSLRSCVVPLWNPHLHSGMPFAADNQSGLFYPVNLVVFALLGPPSYQVMEGLVVLHIWIAAVGTFVLLRGFRLRRSAAVLGALAYALSDVFITHIGNLNLNATAAWLPLALWATGRSLDTRSASRAVVAGLILSVAALAGHAQMLLYVALALALYWFYRLAASVASGGPRLRRRSLQTLGIALLIAAVGLSGAAVMLLPAWELAGHSGRAHLPYPEATRYSLPPRALIGLVAPGFYGRSTAGFWGPWDRVEVGYVGVATLVLAGVGAGLATRRALRSAGAGKTGEAQPNPSSGFPPAYFAALIAVALLLALGRHTPLYRLLYRLVPTFDQVRAPARLVLLADLGLAAMAAYGLDHLAASRDAGRRHLLWLGLTAVAAAVLLLAIGLPQARAVPPPDRVTQAVRSIVTASMLLAASGHLLALVRWGSWVTWAFPLLLAADLIGLGSTLEIERQDPTLGFRRHEVVDLLEDAGAPARIDSTAAAWQPSAALMHGLYDVGGVYNPLGLAPYQAYRWAVGDRSSLLYNLLGVRYVLVDAGHPVENADLTPVHATEEIDVYLNSAALPRAFVVDSAKVVRSHAEAWDAIHGPSFSPTQTVVLEQHGTRRSDDVSPETDSTRVEFLRYGLNAVELHVETPVGGWLVLSDVYYPGWRATVDGLPAPVLRADYAFRAVSVPAGSHDVRMVFAPTTWYVGLTLTVAAWLGSAAVLAVAARRRPIVASRLAQGPAEA